jgi:hypothetical protein
VRLESCAANRLLRATFAATALAAALEPHFSCSGRTSHHALGGCFTSCVSTAAVLLATNPASDIMQASAARCKAEACPKAALLRQLLGAVAAGQAALEEVAPTRYNLVRLVLVSTRLLLDFLPEDHSHPVVCGSSAR